MSIKKAMKKLEHLIQSYGPFWHEWMKNENCSLTIEDLYIIEVHTKDNFKINLFETFMFYNQTRRVEIINAKLIWDCKKFKQWVILNFLFSIVELARKNGGQHYLHRPIGTLELNEKLKQCLFKLDVLYLNQIFEKYKEEDLENEKIFKTIFEFESSKRLNKMLENKFTTYRSYSTN
ncbi:MAG: hypothetical protein JNJ41_11515 [Bacteroidia bacterium]|nr:hypothetical protein [Bacteroidia bacterium]